MELNTTVHPVGEMRHLGKDQKSILMSFLTITCCWEVGKTFITILGNQISNYQMNKKINNTKDDFGLNPMMDINKV